MIKSIFEKLTGVDKIKQEISDDIAESSRIGRITLAEVSRATQVAQADLEEALRQKDIACKAAEKAERDASFAKLSAKEKATHKNEPWIGVLDTHVNPDNVRNGFFELDWNDLFLTNLKQQGYGADGDKDEEIIDRWFRELCAGVVVDGDYGGTVSTGIIDIADVQKNNK